MGFFLPDRTLDVFYVRAFTVLLVPLRFFWTDIGTTMVERMWLICHFKYEQKTESPTCTGPLNCRCTVTLVNCRDPFVEETAPSERPLLVHATTDTNSRQLQK